MPWCAATFLIGIVGLIAGAGVIALAFLWRPGRCLKAQWRARRDGNGFRATFHARSAPLWLATSEILDAFADDNGLCGKDGVPSMRFETHDNASMLFRHVDIDLAATRC
jgi:hypothetical protein